jgi:FG-GAP-like repeat
MKSIFTGRTRMFWCLVALFLIGGYQLAVNSGNSAQAQKERAVPETATPQTLPFSQNWTNVGLITANDDWSGVPGIVGFLGDFDPGAVTAVDPRTLLTPFATNNIDVIANQASAALTNGGVGEFDGIANPVVALQGSGTADAPHIIIYLNTTGLGTINFTCNIRDIDDSADNATQQVDVQYRVGGAGNYASVTGGYIADASSGPSTTMTTPLNLTLPAAADNQSQVEIRVITTNAIGSDEWVGVDDISVTGTPAAPGNTQHYIDMNGDGKTDYSVVRNTGGGPGGQITWFTQYAGTTTPQYDPWGIASDFFVPGNYDGDNKTDVAVWRPASQGYYILQSQTGTLRAEFFGLSGDDPRMVGDYDGDGKDDIAVYRAGASSGAPSFWYWRTSLAGPVFAAQWGQNGDFPVPGDFDGDGKNDFVVQRNNGGGQARFWRLFATGSSDSLVFGTPTDVVVPGDYDGDGKTDVATIRGVSGQILWWVHRSGGGADTAQFWGNSATDFPTQGDYDGDGKTDIAIWRPNADPTQNYYYVLGSTSGFFAQEWGQNGDYPVANYNAH